MKTNRGTKLSILSVLSALPLSLTAGNAKAFDESSNYLPDHGVQLSLALDFGSSKRVANGLNLVLGYADTRVARGYAPLPILQARYADGKWRSLMVSGVDTLTLRQKLAEAGESSSRVPWIIGGLVGAGAVAIGVRYATKKTTPAFDLSNGTGPRGNP